MPSYFVDLPGRRDALRWAPEAGPIAGRPDTRYFGLAFTAMERELRDQALTVYLTWDADRLPEYGNDVVAVLLGDEVGRVPRYSHRVRAVFKGYGTRPALGPVMFDLLGLAALAQWGYRGIRWLPGAAVHALGEARLRSGGGRAGRVFPLPVGTYNQLDLPVSEISRRPVDIFFAGSIAHRRARRRPLSPKELARGQMLQALHRLEHASRGLALDIRTTPDFTVSATASAREYSEALMRSKVCLAPRGTSLETFRVLEGLRYGCVVVTESLPHRWFYDGAPLLRIRRWRELERVLTPLLADPVQLSLWQRRSLAWWESSCSESAVGRYLARILNALACGEP